MSKRKTVIGFDIDNTLFDLLGSVQEKLKERNIEFDPNSVKTYSMKEVACRKQIFECFNNPECFAKMKPVAGVEALFSILHNAKVQYFFESISLNQEVADVKHELLRNHIAGYDETKYRKVLFNGLPKEYKGATIVVEDDPNYFESEDFLNSDKLGIIVDRSYNRGLKFGPRVKRVYHIMEILKFFDDWHIGQDIKVG